MSGMKRLRFQDRLIDPRSPDKSPRRAAYALPTLFTAGNVFLGFLLHHGSLPRRTVSMRKQTASAAAQRTFSSSGDRHRRGRVSRRFGRPHRAHDQDGERFRPRNGFAGRRNQFRHRARRAGLRLGHRVCQFTARSHYDRTSASRWDIFARFCSCYAERCAWRASMCKSTRCPRIPDAPIANTSWECRFPPPPAWWRAWSMRSPKRPAGMVGFFGGVAGAARAAFIPDGQHLALSQLQGPQSGAASIAVDLRRCWSSHHLT